MVIQWLSNTYGTIKKYKTIRFLDIYSNYKTTKIDISNHCFQNLIEKKKNTYYILYTYMNNTQNLLKLVSTNFCRQIWYRLVYTKIIHRFK